MTRCLNQELIFSSTKTINCELHQLWLWTVNETHITNYTYILWIKLWFFYCDNIMSYSALCNDK
jgi:hypothetical protein